MQTPKPVLLDLFCGAGGVAKGFQNAGFYVIGVDLFDQPDYCGDEFHRGDALTLGAGLIHRADAVTASPPCPGEGTLSLGTDKSLATKHPRLIHPTRALLQESGLPYVIENVTGSDVRADVVLCGEMFGLGVIMHRKFELGGWSAPQPGHIKHRGYVRGWRHGVYRDGPYVAAYGRGGGKATVTEMREAKGIDWTTDHLSLRDAIPPAYTEYLGKFLMEDVTRRGRRT